MAAQILAFRGRRVDEFQPGDRVIGTVDGETREGTIYDTGDLVGPDLWIGPPGGEQQHFVAVVWDNPQMVDVTSLHHA